MNRIPSVGAVMTPFPHVVHVDDSLIHARAMMVEHDVRHLPVKDGNTLVGIITDRDLKRALDPALGLPPKEELFVKDVFVPDAFIIDSAQPLDLVLEELVTRHIGSALVTKKDHLAGIFTLSDGCRIFCEHLRALFPVTSGTDIA
jgi:acetoin utilization protein AcuB